MKELKRVREADPQVKLQAQVLLTFLFSEQMCEGFTVSAKGLHEFLGVRMPWPLWKYQEVTRLFDFLEDYAPGVGDDQNLTCEAAVSISCRQRTPISDCFSGIYCMKVCDHFDSKGIDPMQALALSKQWGEENERLKKLFDE